MIDDGNKDSIKALRVLMMPDYRTINPYQTLLSQALDKQGAEVVFPTGYYRVLPIYRTITKNHHKIDILHIHWANVYLKGKHPIIKLIYALKFILDILLTKLAGIQIVWTVHNHISHDSQYPKLEHFIQEILLKLVDKIIVHHYSAINILAANYKINNQIKLKINVVPHGHYRDVYHPPISKIEARQALNLPIQDKVYLNLGILRPYKGIEGLLKVWGEHIENLPNSTLLIAGKALDKFYEQNLTKIAANTDRVILHTDFVEDSKIHLFFSAADVVVLPFEKILTSGSLILAMSYDKPIVAPRTDSILETLGIADRLLYESGNDESLFQALKASQEINLSQLSNLVRSECDKLNWQDIAIKTYEIYNNAKSENVSLNPKFLITNKSN